ncbi:MAG TPA: hypothetical protein VNA89_11120 [Gemmatimonadaceae bacterium]|nr:hypothetical protein [Gemmatimonadaceae bacterium]
MIDSEYFRTVLQTHVDAMGGDAVVELHLAGGRTYRVLSVLVVHSGYVTLEVDGGRGDARTSAGRWRGKAAPPSPGAESRRAVVPYESVVDVTITPATGGDGIGQDP